jgi:hypothetical protein
MTRRYPPHHPQSLRPLHPADQPRPQWWRPLTRWWGIAGVIIFIGLVLSLTDEVNRRAARKAEANPATSSSAPQAAQLDRSSSRPQPASPAVQRRQP